MYELSTAVVAALTPYTDKIKDAMQRHHLEAVLEVILTITQDDSVEIPAVGFDMNVISFLSDVGASIDVDIYRG